MEQKTPSIKSSGKDQIRKDRLKAALKANMAKRKSQTRQRSTVQNAQVSSEESKG